MGPITFEECLILITYYQYLKINIKLNTTRIITSDELFLFVKNNVNDSKAKYLFLNKKTNETCSFDSDIVKKAISNYCKKYDIICNSDHISIHYDDGSDCPFGTATICINIKNGSQIDDLMCFISNNQSNLTTYLNNYIIKKKIENIDSTSKKIKRKKLEK